MNKKTFWILVLSSLVALSVLFLVTVVKYGQTKLVFCDVGQGNGVILSRGEFQLIYDVGPKNGKMLNCLAQNLPFWDKQLEVVIVSHWDIDHSGGLGEIDDYYKINSIYSSRKNEQVNDANILALKDILRNSWMEFNVKWTSQEGDDNYGSVVGLLIIGEFELLLMGDVPIEVEQRLVWRKVLTDKVDTILIGHHGSKNSTSDELLKMIHPKEAIISVGKNSYGHPSVEVIKRLEEYEVKIRRTDREGDIKVLYI